VSIDSQGLTNSTTLLDAADRLVHDGITSIAALVFATTFLMPALEIMALIYLLLPLHFGRLPPGLSLAFRLVHLVKPWAMIEVFMLGLLVTISKLTALATVVPDIGLISFILLMFSITAASANFDARNFWSQIDVLEAKRVQGC
jgi:paraquat-inducible protein A